MQQTRQELPMSIKQLDAAVGLTELKQTVHQIYDMCEYDRARGYAADRRCPNFIFVGNPGTGKTTAAQRIGRILRDCGVLLGGQVHISDRSRLVGKHIGETAKLVKAEVKSSLGGVLFIDEAYSLVAQDSANDFGHEAVATLIQEMEKYKTLMTVVLAGYPGPMADFLRTNPGLESRFTETIHFEDYTDEELVRIAANYCRRNDFRLTENGKKAFLTTISRRRYSDRFGNGREVEQVMDAAFRRKASYYRAGKVKEESMKIIDRDCFPDRDEHRDTAEDYMRKLNSMIGLDKAKSTIRRLIDDAIYMQQEIEMGYRRAEDTAVSGHYCFIGNPGTGKTTAARLFGKILYLKGITKSDVFIEASRGDLVAGYSGQTALKTKEICKKAYGGILFIDEAYSLVQGDNDSFGREALDTLIKEMEDNRDKLVVIFAGYKKEMEEFLSRNSGLRSRISDTIIFEDYSESELLRIFISIQDDHDAYVSRESEQLIMDRIHEISIRRGRYFGNGREMRRLFEEIYGRTKSRVVREHIVDRYERHLIIESDVA